jgi:DNA-binding HxlR family transcriptional regulator
MTETELQMSPEHKQNLSDEEFADLLGSIGNHHGKLLLLSAMKPNQAYSVTKLHALYRDIQGEDKGWVPARLIPQSYCRDSLVPAGVIAEEIIETEPPQVSYKITEKGTDLGLSLAGTLLDFADRYDFPIMKAFGTTHNSYSGSRPSLLRWQILQAIATQPLDYTMNANEFAVSIDRPDMSESINATLRGMQDSGLFTYEDQPTTATRQIYALDKAKLQTAQALMTGDISRAIADEVIAISDNKEEVIEVTTDDLFPGVSKKLQELGINIKKLHINAQLNNWKRAGIVEARVGSPSEARVEVSERQQQIIGEICQSLCDIRDMKPEALDRGHRLAQEIVNDPAKVSKLLKQERERSPHYAGQIQSKLRLGRITSILMELGGEANYTAIQVRLRSFETNVSIGAINRTIREGSEFSVYKRGSQNIVALIRSE